MVKLNSELQRLQTWDTGLQWEARTGPHQAVTPAGETCTYLQVSLN